MKFSNKSAIWLLSVSLHIYVFYHSTPDTTVRMHWQQAYQVAYLESLTYFHLKSKPLLVTFPEYKSYKTISLLWHIVKRYSKLLIVNIAHRARSLTAWARLAALTLKNRYLTPSNCIMSSFSSHIYRNHCASSCRRSIPRPTCSVHKPNI